MASKNSAALSLPKSRTVRGYEIRKMPIGAFLEACGVLEELPQTALRLLFPGKQEGDILTELAGLMEPPITKPAMNHRMKKLVELAKETDQ